MIDSMYQDRIDANLNDQVKRPSTAPAAGPGVWTNFASGFGGLVAGGFNAAAGEADQVGGFGQVTAAGGAMSGGGMFSLQSDAERAQTVAAHNKLMAEGVDMSSAAGDKLRAKAKAFMPDPQTTGSAAQILAGLGDFGSQAMAAGLAGPAGLVDLGVNRGLQRSDELKQEGVSFGARTAVGAVSGLTDAGSMLLPMSGASALLRAGKGAAGGVASSVAGTEAQKLILEHQGYSSIASTMDPFDPVSLALSALVPAGFGAAFGHGAKAPGMAKAEPTRADVTLTPAEQAHSDAVEANSIDTDIASLHAEIAGQKDAGARATLQAELDRLTKQKQAGVAKGLAQDPNNVAAARTQQVADAIDSSRLTPDDDLGGYTTHTQALESASDSIARGVPVEVSHLVDAGPEILRNQIELVKRNAEDDFPNADLTLAKLPPVPDGYARLYRGESPTSGFADVFKPEDVQRFASDRPGVRYANDFGVADYYRDAYNANGDATMHYIDVPQSVADRTHLVDGEHIVDLATINRARAAELARARAAMAPAEIATKPDHASFRAAKAEAESGESRPGAAPPAEKSAAGSAETGPAPSHLASAAADLAASNPDMLVHLDGMEAPMRVGDLLEHLAQEAKETKREAGLLEVAARCALSFGAT